MTYTLTIRRWVPEFELTLHRVYEGPAARVDPVNYRFRPRLTGSC